MNTRKPLDKALRSGLERTVIKARDIAEKAATQALERLAVGDNKAPDYLDESQRILRNQLRAHGRQLGDIRRANGEQGISKLVTEVAYEHWHRMLFAKFLEQNSLLMYDQYTPITIDECNELVQDGVFQDELEQQCNSGWALAGVLASKMLPQIFRIDSPVFKLQFAPELQRELEKLVVRLPPEVFLAQDSLGWVYQFWQSKRKDEVNKSEVKIGADELSPVTQLFTEPYMVSFLLDNSLGAWWAGKRLSQDDLANAQSEQELREKAAIPGAPLTYLRFVKEDDQWQPASGFFEGWPDHLSELKTLDPCCGSGHFLVAAFLMLVPMRMEMEKLTAQEAVDRVLSENIHGLELDQRCVELAAFALALEAWRYPKGAKIQEAIGFRQLQKLNIACSGINIKLSTNTLPNIVNEDLNISDSFEALLHEFSDASILGSLIEPSRLIPGKAADQFEALLNEIVPSENPESHELTVLARGMAEAVRLLSIKYHLVSTNFPFLGLERQDTRLADFLKNNHEVAKRDLATSFLKRSKGFAAEGGAVAIVMPGEWTFKPSHRHMRGWLLENASILMFSSLGRDSFATGLRVAPVLPIIVWGTSRPLNSSISCIELNDVKYEEKQQKLLTANLVNLQQIYWANTPDQRFICKPNILASDSKLGKFADARLGISAGDGVRFEKNFWEISCVNHDWEFLHGAVPKDKPHSGCSWVVFWEGGNGKMFQLAQSVKHMNHAAQNWQRGRPFWNKRGILVSQMGGVTNYEGQIFDSRTLAIVPENQSDLPPLLAFAMSGHLMSEVKKLDDGYKINSPRTFLDVNFDVNKWSNEFAGFYPNGFPKPYTNDPTQWIFHGHPCGSVIWDEDRKCTVEAGLRVDDTVLQIAVARVLGYQWPAELDADMELADEQRAWVERCHSLNSFVDDDGIVCIPPVRGEKSADIRLEALLEAAYGDQWTVNVRNQLLQAVGSKSLIAWLRDKFFEQHCKLFQHRPFIWHIWDGLKDGFSVLVNYHKLDKAGLERLIYTYLGDWIRTQQAAVNDGVDGADVKLGAAQTLKAELENILRGEKPYDIFVRWKSESEQPIGWEPDLNDGVRLNIRPFMLAREMGKKGAGLLRTKPNIKWTKDRGTDVESAPWYHLGPDYDEKPGARINEHHLSLAEKQHAKDSKGSSE